MDTSPRGNQVLVSGPNMLGLALLGLATTAALAWFIQYHIARTGFWYDESVQLWMSLGLDAFGEPLTPRGPLRAINAQNARGNLDPGGFSLLLGLWIKVSTNEIWLRTLPLLFFLAGMLALAWLGWTWRKSIAFAVLSGVVPAAFPLLLDYSIEVRAYSMEFAGIAIGCLLLALLIRKPTMRLAFFAGTVFGLFLTSRYSYGLFVAASVIALAAALIRQHPVRPLAALTPVLWLLIPLAILSAAIFLVLFLPQYKARISYQGGAMLDYLRVATTVGKSVGEIASMAASNLLRPSGLPLTLMACVGLFAVIPHRWRERTGVASLSPPSVLFGVLALSALILNALVWRWHPWDMSTKWSLWLHALSAVAVVRLASAVLELGPSPNASGWENQGWIAIALVVAVLALQLRLASYRRPDHPTIVHALAHLEKLRPPAGSVTVDGAWYPTVRQFYEYGSFAGSPLYPTAFRLPSWNGPRPLVTTQTRWLITHRSLADAQAEFPQVTIVQDATLPRQLYRVEPLITKASYE